MTKIIIGTLVLLFILFSSLSLYGFYGILSATMYSSDIVISGNETATSQVIIPCLINTTNGTCDSHNNYILINTTVLCSGGDIFGNRYYPEEMCINDNEHCVDYLSYERGFYCSCFTNPDTQYLMNSTNYLLIYIIIVIVIIIFEIIFVVFALLVLLYKRFKDYKQVEEEKERKEEKDSKEKMIFLVTIFVIICVGASFVLLSNIVLPILLYTGIANPLCDYVSNECYYVNFELNAVISNTCYPYSYYDYASTAAYILLTTIIIISIVYFIILVLTLFSTFAYFFSDAK